MSWIQSDLQQSQTEYVPPEWSSGTDEEIVEALEKHYAGEIDLHEYWSVGDERTIHLSAMDNSDGVDSQYEQDVTFVITAIGGKMLANGTTECAFQVDQKNCLSKLDYHSRMNTGSWDFCSRRQWCNNTYKNAFPSTIIEIFKPHINYSGYERGTTTIQTIDTFALRAPIEVTGTTNYSVTGEGTFIPYFSTSANRYKNQGNSGSNCIWWTRSIRKNYYYESQYCGIVTGNESVYDYSNSFGIAPFGVI